MATTYTTPPPSVDSSPGRALAWFGVALQAVAFVAVWLLQRWNGLWTNGGLFLLSLGFMLLQRRIPSLIASVHGQKKSPPGEEVRRASNCRRSGRRRRASTVLT